MLKFKDACKNWKLNLLKNISITYQKMIKLKKNYRTSEVSFSHIPQNEYSCIAVGFMNDTEIQNGNSKRLRLYFCCFLTTETRVGTAGFA